MRNLPVRPFVNVLVALSVALTPNLALARETTAGDPVPPERRQTNAALEELYRRPTPDDPTQRGQSRVRLTSPQTNLPRNRALVPVGPRVDHPRPTPRPGLKQRLYNAATATRGAARDLKARHEAFRNRNADRVDAARQKVADRFYSPALDPKVPIPSSRALDFPRFTLTPQGFAPINSAMPAQPALVEGEQRYRPIPRFARDGGPTLKASGLEILRRHFGPEQRVEMGKRLHDVTIGKRPLLDFKRVELAGGAAATARVMSEMPNLTLTFGLAMGAAAAMNLLWDYPSNPLAWEKYLEEMNDPVGWLGIAGFALAMAPFTALMSTEKIQRAGFAAQTPILVSGLALGALVQNGVAAFARDEDVRACLGFKRIIDGFKTGFASGERFNDAKDPAACDRVETKFANGQLSADVFMKSVPSMAAVAISGTLTYAVIYGVHKYIPLDRILALAGVTAGNSPMGLALRGAYSLGMTMFFLLVHKMPSEALAQSWGDAQLAYWGKQGPVYANTVWQAQTDLTATWERARAAGWRDPGDFTGKDVCKDPRRVGSPYYDCAKPRELDFAGALQTQAGLVKAWRERKMKPVLDTWQAWTDKVTSYRTTYDLAKTYYDEAITKIVFTRKNPDAPASDKRVFNLANLDVKTSSAWPRFLRSLVARLDFVPSQDGSLGHVSTPTFKENMVAMMACGPEATGSAAPGTWSTLRDFTGGWLGGNYAPRQVIVDPVGEKVRFYPPRLTKPLVGTSDSACERQFNVSGKTSPLEFLWMRMDSFAPSTLDQVILKVDGKRYQGLTSYILENVREDVISPEGLSFFDAWWDAYVGAADRAQTAKLEAEYQKHMNEALPKAILNQEYEWCETSAFNQTPVGRYVARIARLGGACGPDRTQRLANGALNSLRDQTILYLAMMVDLFVANRAVFLRSQLGIEAKVAENKVIVQAQEALAAYDAYASGQLLDLDAVKSQELATAVSEKMDAFLNIVQPKLVDGKLPAEFMVPATTVKVKTTGKVETIEARPMYQVQWMTYLSAGLVTTLAEWQAYARVAAMQR